MLDQELEKMSSDCELLKKQKKRVEEELTGQRELWNSKEGKYKKDILAQREEIKLKQQHAHVATIKLTTSERQNKEYKMDIQQKDQTISMNNLEI